MNAVPPLLAPLARRTRRVLAEPGATESALRYAIILTLTALIGWAGMKLVTALGTSTATTASPVRAHSPTTRRPPDAWEITKRIATQHWFGVAEAAGQLGSDAPIKTTGAVKVLGIIFASDPQLSRAILALGEKQKSYGVGAKLANGDKVVSVEADRVTLAHDDKRYALVLNRPGSAMLAKAPHFYGGGVAQAKFARSLSHPFAPRPAPAPGPAPLVSSTTLQRLQALRTRLLSGGEGH